MYKVKLAPNVEEKMLKSSFWTDRIKNEPLFSQKQIKEFNQKIYNKAEKENKEEYYFNLNKFSKNLSGDKVSKMIKNTYNSKISGDKNYFKLQGKLISSEKRKEIEANCGLKNLKLETTKKLKYCLLIKRSNIRALPTEMTYTLEKESGDQDLLQLTALSAGTAALIIAVSRDQKWYYIQAKLMRGWVKKDNIALTDNLESAKAYLNSDEFLIVSGSRIETEPSPFDQEVANKFFQMGDKIPLVGQAEAPEEIPENHPHAQSGTGNYLVWLPTKDSKNKLNFKQAIIAVSNDLNQGYLELNRENIIKQAYKMLGERYDWGGKYKRRDCSRFIMDIFRSCGLELPRNADLQEKLSPFKNYIFLGDLEERKAILNKLEAGDILHMPGHIMIYLGEEQNKNYLIHAASGYGKIDKDDNLHSKSIRSVFIMELEQLLKDGQNTYLEKFSSVSKIK